MHALDTTQTRDEYLNNNHTSYCCSLINIIASRIYYNQEKEVKIINYMILWQFYYDIKSFKRLVKDTTVQ